MGADDDDVLLGQVTHLLAGPDGEVFALDTQLAQVLVFGPDGDHRRTLGREGEGPGEFRQPIKLFWTGDGALGVQQAFPSRVVYLDPQDGTPRGAWTLGQGDPESGGFAFLSAARQRGGTFAVSGQRSSFDMDTRQMKDASFLTIIGDDGHEAATLSEVTSDRSMTGFTIDELADWDPGQRRLWDVGPNGHVYSVPSYDAYLLRESDGEGTLVREIARPHEARRRTEAEKEQQRHSMQININGMEPEITWKLQDRAPCVERVRVLDDGTLWVCDSRGDQDWAEQGRRTFAVYDSRGRLQREVTLAAPEPGEGHDLVLLDDGRVMMIRGLDSLSVTVNAGDDDGTHAGDESLGDTLLEIVCFDVVR